MPSSSDLHVIAEDVVVVVGFGTELRQLPKRLLLFEFQEVVLLRCLHDSSSLAAVLTHFALYIAQM